MQIQNAVLHESRSGAVRGWLEQYDRWLVSVLAVVAALTWFCSEPIVFTNDSFGYLTAARYVAGVPTHGIPYYRMPLFPVFLAVTGVPRYSTFSWFVLAQMALGIGMAMLFHDALRGYSRMRALTAVAALTLTFVPFVFSKSVMTEQLYLFGLILCLSSMLSYLQSGRGGHLLMIATAVSIMMLTRVQGLLIGFVVLPFLLLGRPAHWRSIMVSVAGVVFVIGTYSLVYSTQLRHHDQFHSESATTPSLSNSVGKYLFMVPFLDAERYFGWKMVMPTNGPASAMLVALTGDTSPTLDGWWGIWQTLDREIGVAASNELLMRATIEAVTAHPFEAAVLYAHNLTAATYRLDSPYVWQHPPVTIDDDRLNEEFKASGDQSSVTWLARIINPLFHGALIVATILVVLTIGAHGTHWAFCVAAYLYNLFTIALSGAPEGRIVFYGLPLLLAALATMRSTPWLLRVSWLTGAIHPIKA
jgi:hypothetical protein